MMPATEGPRIDKWLWAVRLFKTRSQATEACRAGKVKISDQPVKASRDVREGDIINIYMGIITKTVRVKSLLGNRVAAKLVENYLEDLTPAGEYEKIEVRREMKQGIRPRGYGRPTKKERRDMENSGLM